MRPALPALAAILMGLATPAPAQLGGPALPVQSPAAPELLQRELDRAFDALRTAPDEAGGRMAEAAVRQLWSRQATPAVALLLNRGIRTLRGGQPGDALEDFDAAILLEPSLADAWHWRAQAHAAVGDRQGAATDLRGTPPARCAASAPRWRSTPACPAARPGCASWCGPRKARRCSPPGPRVRD
ncbi:tetratricopeptide repeat protein [Roseococcus thiosulfatophilus]|uniref:hypothetical protein n=1 Tax=Roseococcus thiosulfatophilus TaxID=35813 RepID=UPI001A8BFA7E|nr:hypothetical protein [Roseococcus thiosulfatophilus]